MQALKKLYLLFFSIQVLITVINIGRLTEYLGTQVFIATPILKSHTCRKKPRFNFAKSVENSGYL